MIFSTVCVVHSNKEDVDRVAVTTAAGTFVGYVYNTAANGESVSTRRFLGIPYAQPPVGDLRFKKPVKMGKLDEPYDATDYGPACMQQAVALGGPRKPGVMDGITMSEDCLFLNVYTPNKETQEEKLPVMMFFHGGGFVLGSTIVYPGDVVASYGDVIWVTVAYRLSIWGFLSTGDENLPGNYGLWDQHMAIQWVHEHIANFGGNPDAITLIGTSAGGASTVYQSMFPGNMGLVKRAIPQSGSVTNPCTFNPDPLTAAKRLAGYVGCGTHVTSKDLADCIISKSTDQLHLALNKEENGFVRFPMEFLPTVDHEFLRVSPFDIFNDTSSSTEAHHYTEALSQVDLLTGLVSGEGQMMLIPFAGVADMHTFEVDRYRFEHKLVPEALRITFGDDVPAILTDLLVHEYTNWNDPDNDSNSRESYINMSGDYVLNIQTVETAKVHALISGKNTYVYLYDAFLQRRVLEVPTWLRKAQHGDELTTLLGFDEKDGFMQWLTPHTEDPPEKWEQELSKAHIILWTNFAKSGNPNEPRDVKPFIKSVWPKYDMTSQRYLNISRQMSENSVQQGLFARASNFWNQVLPGVIEAIKAGPRETKRNFCERDDDCEP